MKIRIGKIIAKIIGVILAFVLAFALEGLIWWCIVNGICMVFNIKFHLAYFPNAVILAMVGTLVYLPFRRSGK